MAVDRSSEFDTAETGNRAFLLKVAACKVSPAGQLPACSSLHIGNKRMPTDVRSPVHSNPWTSFAGSLRGAGAAARGGTGALRSAGGAGGRHAGALPGRGGDAAGRGRGCGGGRRGGGPAGAPAGGARGDGGVSPPTGWVVEGLTQEALERPTACTSSVMAATQRLSHSLLDASARMWTNCQPSIPLVGQNPVMCLLIRTEEQNSGCHPGDGLTRWINASCTVRPFSTPVQSKQREELAEFAEIEHRAATDASAQLTAQLERAQREVPLFDICRPMDARRQ